MFLTLVASSVLLVLLAAILTAAEAATFRVSSSRLRTLQEEGFAGADALVQLRGDPSRTRAATRLAFTAFVVSAGGLATLAGLLRQGAGAGVLALAVAVLVIMAVAVVLPRTIAARQPVRLALASAPAMVVFTRWFHLLAAPVTRLEGALAGEAVEDVSHEERELREIQQIGQAAGILEEEENLLVERAFRLDELTTWDVLTPRVDIFAWSESLTLDAIVDQLPEVPFSRVPVYDGSIDDITGILYVREAYQAYIDGRRDVTLGSLAREPFFVPGSLSLARLLQDFQVRRIHMGIVADEFGGIEGLVTLEDVLEELVGEIVDETDVDEEELVRVSRTQLVADAGVDVREINYAFNVSLPLVEHRSLNGFILDEMGYVPDAGESLERSGVHIEVMESTDTQVLRARLTRLPTERAAETDGEGEG